MKRKTDVALSECLVCDIGSSSIKAGHATDELPRVVMPTLVGRPVVNDRSRHFEADENMLDEYIVLRPRARGDDRKPSLFASRDIVVGQEAREKHSQLDLSRPVDGGIVKNWDDLELILDRIFAPLRANTSDNILTPANKQRRRKEVTGGAIVLSDLVDAPVSQREKFCELFFERFSFDRINLSPAAALTLTARGTSTGLVVDCGGSKTEVVPVFSGFVQKNGVKRTSLGGNAVLKRFFDLLKRSDSCNYKLDADRDSFRLQSIMEQICFVAPSVDEERFVAETTNVLARSFELPDKTKIVVNSERFLAPEVLFAPDNGIDALVKEAIAACPIDVKPAMMKAITISGGCSLMKGFSSKLRSSVGGWVDEVPDRQFLPFLGGCAMAATNDPESEWWICKSEFEETGAAGVIKRLLGPKSYRI